MSGLGDSPAFPTLGDEYMTAPDGSVQPKSAYGMDGKPGMTYRQWLAGKALSGLCADPGTALDASIGAKAMQVADALIAALEGTPASSGEPAAKPEPKPAEEGTR